MENSLESELNDLVEYLESLNELNASDLSEDAEELKSNLIELIALKKDELLDYKKSVLLEKCDYQTGYDESNEISVDDDSVGSIRSMQFRFYNGQTGLRNVVIFEAISGETGIYYTVFFTHPVYTSELPCQRFLNNVDCPYKSSCKYSHGLKVAFIEIKESVNLNEPISEGDICLVLLNDGDIWKKSKILHIDCNNNCCVIELIKLLDDRSNKVFNVDFNRIAKYPNMMNDDSQLDNLMVDDNDGEKGILATGGTNTAFGDWERHTKGIGMKLLLKMGYKLDSGLGRHNQGRLQPVAVAQLDTNQQNSWKRNNKKGIKQLNISAVPKVDSSSSNSRDKIKSALVRNEDRLVQLRHNIESLQNAKLRHNNCQLVLDNADKKIESMNKKIAELNKTDKLLQKKLALEKSDKPKKLNIF